MISKVDLIDFWEITRALYGNGESSEAEMAVVRLLVDTADTGITPTATPADGALAARESALAA